MKTYIIPGGIVNSGIRDNVPRIHKRKIKMGKDLVGVEVKEGRIPHDTASTTIQSRSAVRRHVDVKQGNLLSYSQFLTRLISSLTQDMDE